jgi:hypothetical protein
MRDNFAAVVNAFNPYLGDRQFAFLALRTAFTILAGGAD